MTDREKILAIGDGHYLASRKKAIKTAEKSILTAIKGQDFDRIVLLGDLFDKKPTAEERCMLADFLNKLRRHTDHIDFIVGNGRHTFEAEHIHEKDWMDLCEDFHQHEELEIGKYVFAHSEFKGLVYVNGFESESKREIDPDKVYISGHIHSPSCSFKNVHYVGSVYKTAFDQVEDQKQICIIEKGKLEFIPIESRPMYTITLSGCSGKVKASGLKKAKETGCDLKIIADSDEVSLGAVHQAIRKIKDKYDIEYYRQDIKIKGADLDVPENLDRKVLLKKYCKKVNIEHGKVLKELE